jgi:hypothetical protein
MRLSIILVIIEVGYRFTRFEAIAKEFDMDSDERREFGDYVEDCKRRGEQGAGKDGDFTYGELRGKVSEFREE